MHTKVSDANEVSCLRCSASLTLISLYGRDIVVSFGRKYLDEKINRFIHVLYLARDKTHTISAMAENMRQTNRVEDARQFLARYRL